MLFSGLAYRPDIAVCRAERLASKTLTRLDLPPDLIVEVLSPSTKPYDLVTKRGDYDRFGVAEYWVVDPNDAGIRGWTRRGTEWEDAPRSPDVCIGTAIAGFTLDVAPVRMIASGE